MSRMARYGRMRISRFTEAIWSTLVSRVSLGRLTFKLRSGMRRDMPTVGDTRVLQATAPPMAVLARFAQEAEVVVAPHLLRDITELGSIKHFVLPRLTPF